MQEVLHEQQTAQKTQQAQSLKTLVKLCQSQTCYMVQPLHCRLRQNRI